MDVRMLTKRWFLSLTVVASFFNLSSVAVAYDHVVYGTDNRRDAQESTNPLYKEWSRSTAAMISKNNLKIDPADSMTEIIAVKNPMGVCPGEPFSQQFMAANCSGFLVAPDILVTAGHCMDHISQCKENAWVFDFRSDTPLKNQHPSIPQQQIYNCAEILSQQLDSDTKMDYAVIRLDRKVKDREPFSVRTLGSVSVGEEMVVIGHPSGLPLKVTDGAMVRSTDHESYFVFNGDTFQGNSGSPVINVKTGEIEGILVRGDRDYIFDGENDCFKVNYCEEGDCRGEDVTKITEVFKRYQASLQTPKTPLLKSEEEFVLALNAPKNKRPDFLRTKR
jgi:hypothetical protein